MYELDRDGFVVAVALDVFRNEDFLTEARTLAIQNFPNGTPVTDEDLLDAVVYGNNQPPMLTLLDVLTPNGVQLNESAEGLADYQSLSRVPDGGDPQTPGDFILQAPTPGYSNVLLCDGGQIAKDERADG